MALSFLNFHAFKLRVILIIPVLVFVITSFVILKKKKKTEFHNFTSSRLGQCKHRIVENYAKQQISLLLRCTRTEDNKLRLQRGSVRLRRWIRRKIRLVGLLAECWFREIQLREHPAPLPREVSKPRESEFPWKSITQQPPRNSQISIVSSWFGV